MVTELRDLWRVFIRVFAVDEEVSTATTHASFDHIIMEVGSALALARGCGLGVGSRRGVQLGGS